MVNDYETQCREMEPILIESIIASGIAGRIGAHEIVRIIDADRSFRTIQERYLFVLELNAVYTLLKDLPNIPELKELRKKLSLDRFKHDVPTTKELTEMSHLATTHHSRTAHIVARETRGQAFEYSRITRMLRERRKQEEVARKAARFANLRRLMIAIPLPSLKRRAQA